MLKSPFLFVNMHHWVPGIPQLSNKDDIVSERNVDSQPESVTASPWYEHPKSHGLRPSLSTLNPLNMPFCHVNILSLKRFQCERQKE